MGVYGLTKLFYGKKASARNGGGWVRKSIQGPLVVDANQFCHQTCDFLTNVKHPRSGSPTNYAMFFEYVTKILHKFKRCGIEPYFIFDGVDKKKLSSEYRKRAVSKNSIPTLVYTVFYNALREMEVKMYVAVGEGDVTCAEVANFFKCPVLSYDSDFFLFDIAGGYIDLKACLSENIFDSDSATLKAEVYYRKKFVNHHFPRNNDSIFLYPAIIGNGINRPTGDLIDNRKRWSVDAVERFVFGRHLTIASLPEGVRKNFKEVKEYYNGLNPLDPQIILTSPIPKCSKQVPEWFRMSYRTRAMPLMPFDALVNGKQHHGSSATPEKIRQCCYTILGIPEVTEYRSTPGGVEEQQIKCLEEIPGRLALEEIESEGDDSKKKCVLYFAMECERQAAELENLSSEGDRFFLCTVIFWMSKTAPPNNLVKALLACFVRLSNIAERQEIVRLCHQTSLPQSAHSGNQLVLKEWQCVYQDALILFFLLRYSPETAPCPSRIFDENIILSLLASQVIDDAILEFIKDESLSEKYQSMLKALGL